MMCSCNHPQQINFILRKLRVLRMRLPRQPISPEERASEGGSSNNIISCLSLDSPSSQVAKTKLLHTCSRTHPSDLRYGLPNNNPHHSPCLCHLPCPQMPWEVQLGQSPRWKEVNLGWISQSTHNFRPLLCRIAIWSNYSHYLCREKHHVKHGQYPEKTTVFASCQ